MNQSVQMTLEGKKEKSKLCFGCMENERDLNIYAKVNIKTNPQYGDFELIEKWQEEPVEPTLGYEDDLGCV